MDQTVLSTLRTTFGDRLRENVPLAGYTSARIGGPADVLITIRSAQELEESVTALWRMDVAFLLIGGGSNILVSDRGVRGVTLVNRARQIQFDRQADQAFITAESGATLNELSQRAALHGLSGLEWAASVPGTLGGAVFGNAGAFGGEMAQNLHCVEVLEREAGRQTLTNEQMEYGYRTSIFKEGRRSGVILAATLTLVPGEKAEIQSRMAENNERRRKTQPPGASMGSMFKNPPGDKAGRLLEAAGLKGKRIGGAQISPQHANFFINTEKTRAEDMKALLELAQHTVLEKSGIQLEPEIQLIGDWSPA